MKWLKQHGFFPLEGFVHVDPDKIREMLPESKEYLRRNRETAGMLTQKETGYEARASFASFSDLSEFFLSFFVCVCGARVLVR